MRQLETFIAMTAVLLGLSALSFAQQPNTPAPNAAVTTPPTAANIPDPEAEIMKRVMEAYNSGDLADANSLLSDFIKQYPNAASGYVFRSILRERLNDHDGALADLDKVIELRPNIGSVYVNRAMERLNNGDSTGAIKDLDQAIALQYIREIVYDLRSTLRGNLGDDQGALADRSEAIRLNPNNPLSYGRRARLLVKLKDHERALVDLNYLLNWYETDPVARPVPPPPSPPAQSTPPATAGAKGDSLMFNVELGDKQNPSPADEKMKPVIVDAYRLRGWLLSLSGDHEKAIADISKAIKLEPEVASSYISRAVENEARGDLENALKDVNLAIQLKSNEGGYLVERIVLLKLLARDPEAQADIDRLLKGNPLWQKRIDDRLAEVKNIAAASHK